MREPLLDVLRCTRCRASFRLLSKHADDKHVIDGVLTCKQCEAVVPIVKGVPDFVAAHGRGTAHVEQTTSGFARNWKRYSDVILASPALNDELFSDWVWPLAVDSFAGRRVLDAGCGMGRWMTVAAPHQPEMLVGFDYSEVAFVAFENTRHLKNVHVVRADIFNLPFGASFDVCYSIGVIHHTPDPAGAFRALLAAVQPKGALSVWVYGEENNAWIEKFVSPFRRIVTSRMSDRALLWLSRLATLQLLAAARAYVALNPQPTAFGYDAYIRHLLRYPPRYVEHIVYDHLVPEIAHYVPRAEVDRWVRDADLHAVVTARNDNSWRVLGARSEDALAQFTEARS